MSDELVQRLRETRTDWACCKRAREAADRIEALEAVLREVVWWQDNHVDEVDNDIIMADIARRALEGKS
jgi:hypothetical protein